MSRPLTIEDLFRVERLSQIELSSEGQNAWIVTKRIDLAANETHTLNYQLRQGEFCPHRLGEKGGSDLCFSGDGKRLFFASEGQIWMSNPDGTSAHAITTGVGGASGPKADFRGEYVLFSRAVYRDREVQKAFETTGKEPSLAQIYGVAHPKARVRIADALMYRHWDAWTENRRHHLFLIETATGTVRDLTPYDADVPPIALDSGCDYAISPDGNSVVFVKNPDKVVARSTNNSIYLLDVASGDCRRISTTDGCDNAPQFLGDGRIGYISMQTPGYEADAQRFKVYDPKSGQTRLYLDTFERSIERFFPISQDKILFQAQDFAHVSLYELDLRDGTLTQHTSGRTYATFACGGGRLLAGLESLAKPRECVELSHLESFSPRTDSEIPSQEQIHVLTHFGNALSEVDMNEGRKLTFKYEGRTIEGYVVTPPNFDETQRYPLILLIHGGPQGAFLDAFHYRWNVEMFASRGAVTVFCNPHGSTGYGHDLTRAISRHWSDTCPKAIMAFVDKVLEEIPQIDPQRLAAAGASFGGFMINWLLGHTDRFRALVSHDGIFNTENSGYMTDELWFCDYEFGGTPYENPQNYERHSPHRFVQNFNTPTLVIQGEQDFRCCTSEGLALFTALQYRGVESRLVYFPTEGHWVLDPANSFVWYTEVINWLMKHLDA